MLLSIDKAKCFIEEVRQRRFPEEVLIQEEG